MAKQLQQPVHQVLIPAEGFLRLPKVLAVIPVKKSTWYNGIRTGRFPKPVHLGARSVAWRVEDIRLLIKSAGSSNVEGRNSSVRNDVSTLGAHQ